MCPYTCVPYVYNRALTNAGYTYASVVCQSQFLVCVPYVSLCVWPICVLMCVPYVSLCVCPIYVLCVCVRVCARACVRVCVCACVRVYVSA